MKPIKLTLSGFGPFLKEVNIDFSYLGKENLYLITGPTGSGKTTILMLSYIAFMVKPVE